MAEEWLERIKRREQLDKRIKQVRDYREAFTELRQKERQRKQKLRRLQD